MSQPGASSDPFVPFDPPPNPAPASSTSPRPPSLKVLCPSDASPGFTPLEARHPAHPPPSPGPAKPKVTLQREGDRVSGIRIECPCGQVIELVCSYDANSLAP